MMRFNKVVFPVRRRGPAGAVGSQGPAAPLTAADETRLATVEELSNFRVTIVYVDGTNGDDSNDGSLSSPFLTLQAAISATNPLHENIIRLLSDCELSEQATIRVNSKIIIQRDLSAPVGTKIRLTGSGRITTSVTANVDVVGVDVELDNDRSLFRSFVNGILAVRIANVTVTKTSTSTASIIDVFNGKFIFSVQTSDLSAVLGFIVSGFPAGSNPNDNLFITTNITSA